MEPDREQPSAEVERLRAETEKLKAGAAKLMAQVRRFDNDATLDVFAAVAAGTEAAESPGW